jgi:surface protein
MQFMFYYASGFNSNISNWNVGAVTVMRYMFDGASSFNQNLCPWGPKLPANFNYGTSGAAYNIFVNSGCANKSTPTGFTGPWCKATCP